MIDQIHMLIIVIGLDRKKRDRDRIYKEYNGIIKNIRQDNYDSDILFLGEREKKRFRFLHSNTEKKTYMSKLTHTETHTSAGANIFSNKIV